MKKTSRFAACAVWCVSILLAAAAACGPAQPADAEDTGAGPARVVAIGDVHGAFPEFVQILQKMGLINDKLQWSGGTTVFVQTGDVPDRGPATRAALDLLMRLESEAPKQNGRVIPLLGNHEVMNMMGDTRYVSVEDYRSFATDQSEKRQAEEWEDYKKFVSQHGHPVDDQGRAQWSAEHPPGFFERRDAFGPEGVYGRWLREHDAIAEVDDALFMHGGLDPKLHFRNIDDLNHHIHNELESFDTTWKSLCGKNVVWPYMTLSEAFRQAKADWDQSGSNNPADRGDLQKLLSLPSGLLMAENSPFWYRGLALQPEEKLDKDVDKMLSRLKVHYLVAAHTVRPKFDITSRFDKRVFLIDTGMLKAYFGGRASALEFKDGRVTAYYADAAPQVLVGPGAATAAGGGAGDSRQ
ncbi:MAG TPA: metallophosphoesterase [Terriglobia bacterium]|nr:metallophosphoesterase [Terriglobia bacterium]